MEKILTFLILLLNVVGFSQRGKVIDESGQPIPLTKVYSYKVDKGTTTDFNGDFNINVPLGTELIFISLGYEKDTLLLRPNMVVTLKSNSLVLNEVVVSVQRDLGSEKVLLIDKKNSVEVESSIGSSELSKKNVNNAEDGLKKVSGVTVNYSKINVRGLDDRYNQVTVNKFPLPSNNTDQKNIDLGLIPRVFIGNIKVRKTYTPNQWSNIGGAQIDINTDKVDTGLCVTYSTNYNTNTLNKLGNNVTLKYGRSLGKFSAVVVGRFSNGYQNNEGFTKIIDKQGNVKLDYNYKTYLSNIDGFGSLLMKYNPTTNLNFKTVSMFLVSNYKNMTYMEGNHFDYNNDIFTSRLTPIKSNLLLQQIIGEYNIGKFTTNFDVSYSIVNSGEKNRNQFVYLKFQEGYRFNNIDKLDNHHFWSQNLEHRYGTSLSGKYESNKIKSELSYNFLGSYTLFDYKQDYYDLSKINSTHTDIDPYNPYNYIQDGNYTINKVNNPASLVEGQTLIHAVYNTTNFIMGKMLLSTGIRLENSYQGIFYIDQIQPTIDRYQIIDSYEFLPSFSMKYEMSKKKQIKIVTSKTVIRPRFRELTPFLYTEMFAGSKIQGNPELINSSVYNGDISYEIYPTTDQMVTFNGFSKYIQNPIERVNVATASGRLETYQNGNKAYIIGGEIETKVKLNNFTIDCNITVMYSKILISNNGVSSVIVTNPERQLQGSTPVLFNLDIFYKNIGFVYTYTGKKLFSAGIQGIGDVYQNNRHQLNLSYHYEKDKLKLDVSLSNLLNSPFTLTQSSDSGIQEIIRYKTGLNVSVGFTYNF